MISKSFSALAGQFRRDLSPKSTWIREIDGLRFVAIFAVVLQHLLERFGRKTALPLDAPLLDDPFFRRFFDVPPDQGPRRRRRAAPRPDCPAPGGSP